MHLNKESAISTLLLSNNLVNVLASSLATAFFVNLFGVTGIFYATLLMTFLLDGDIGVVVVLL